MLFFGDYKKGYFLTIGLSCVCFSHIISFYLVCFFTFLFMIFNIKCLRDKSRLKCLLLYVFLAMIVTIHFWLPMLEQLFLDSFRIDAHRKIFQNVIPIYFIFLDVPYNIITNYYIAGVGVIYYVALVKYFKIIKSNKFLFTIMFLGVIATIFVSIKLIWKIDLFYKIFSVIQFPWRFYICSTVFFIIGFSVIFKYIKFNDFIKLSLIYVCVIFIFNSFVFSINAYFNKPLIDEVMVGEYLPKGFNFKTFEDYKNKDISYSRSSNVLSVEVLKNVDSVELPLVYYRGYKACGDVCYETFKTENGLLGVKTQDVKEFEVWYSGTKIYNVTKYISLLGVCVLIYKIKKCY